MKVSSNLQKALRNNQRRKKLSVLVNFLSERLHIALADIVVPPIEQSDEVVCTFQEQLHTEKRFTFSSVAELKGLFEKLKANLQDEEVFLYSTPLCESCGAIKVSLHLFLDRATDLVILNGKAVSVITLTDFNRFFLSYDTEYSADSNPAAYDLDISGKRFQSAALLAM